MLKVRKRFRLLHQEVSAWFVAAFVLFFQFVQMSFSVLASTVCHSIWCTTKKGCVSWLSCTQLHRSHPRRLSRFLAVQCGVASGQHHYLVVSALTEFCSLQSLPKKDLKRLHLSCRPQLDAKQSSAAKKKRRSHQRDASLPGEKPPIRTETAVHIDALQVAVEIDE